MYAHSEGVGYGCVEAAMKDHVIVSCPGDEERLVGWLQTSCGYDARRIQCLGGVGASR